MFYQKNNWIMEANRIRPTDEVKVEVKHADGTHSTITVTGQHDIDDVIRAASLQAGIYTRDTDVYEITDEKTGVTSSYRINAHGHPRLIV